MMIKIVNVLCGVLVLLSLVVATMSPSLEAIVVIAEIIPLIMLGGLLVMTIALKEVIEIMKK